MVKTTLEIDGMACGMCEAHVNDAIRKAFAVKKVTSSHAKRRTEILSEQLLEEEKLRTTIEATGYKVMSIQSEIYEKKGFSFYPAGRRKKTGCWLRQRCTDRCLRKAEFPGDNGGRRPLG